MRWGAINKLLLLLLHKGVLVVYFLYVYELFSLLLFSLSCELFSLSCDKCVHSLCNYSQILNV